MEDTSEVLSLKAQLEVVKRAYWQSQIQLSQLLIENSIREEARIRDEKPGAQTRTNQS